MKGFALRLVLKQRRKRTRKWLILNLLCLICIIFVCYAYLIIFTWNLRDINVFFLFFFLFFIIHKQTARYIRHSHTHRVDRNTANVQNCPSQLRSGAITGFYMTSVKFKLQSYWSSWYFTFIMFKSSWKLLFRQLFAPNGFLVLWLTTLEFLSFCATRHLHDGQESR